MQEWFYIKWKEKFYSFLVEKNGWLIKSPRNTHITEKCIVTWFSTMSRFFHNIIPTAHLEVLDPYKMFSDVLVECSRCFYTSLIRSVMTALGVASDLHSMKDCTWLHQTYFQHSIILQICLCTHSKLCPFLNSPRYPHTYSISHEYA